MSAIACGHPCYPLAAWIGCLQDASVRRIQTKFPDWWNELKISNRLREKLRATFTIHRDGYQVWYKGQPRIIRKSLRPDAVEDAWKAKRKEIDRGVPADAATLTYRLLLSEFLSIQKNRIGAAKRPLSERTYFNYVSDLNKFGDFVVDGGKIADMDIDAIGPVHFTRFAESMNGWKASGFDSVVCRVGTLFRFAVEMEYIDRFRPGPIFRRPARKELREQRIDRSFSFTVTEVATAYNGAGRTMKRWIALGICAAFVNSDVANMTRAAIDLNTGIIDFRRRKTGKVRRVIPLPPDVIRLLGRYRRPDPVSVEHADLFFISQKGRPYSVTKNANGKPSNTISRLTSKLLVRLKIKQPGDKRNFKSFRTTFFNLAPRGGYDTERMIIMGRAQGTVDLDSYLEDVGIDRLRHVVNHVWGQVKAEIDRLNNERPGEAVGNESAAASGNSTLR